MKTRPWRIIGTLRSGCLLAIACGVAAGHFHQQALQAETIAVSGLSARFDVASGTLSLVSGGRTFATAQFAAPGKGRVTVEKVGADSPFGPGQMLKIAPGENRVALREGSPVVFIRRDGRNAAATMPGRRVEALRATVDLGVDPAKLKGLGPAGLFDPAKNPGQHVVTSIADPKTGAGVVAGIVRIDAVSGVLLTKVEGGKVLLTLRDDYGSAIPPDLEPQGGDWWAIGYFADARAGLETYAAEFARIQGVKLKPVPVGYMSWYSEKYGGALNEKAVVELAGYVAKTFKAYGYGFVQIDDMWQNGQKRNGPAKDFSKVAPNGPYKGGMKPVAEQIHALGLTPGLWILPFAIDHQDPVLAGPAKMVVKKPDGTPYETSWSGTSLDLTRPAARAYVQSFIARAVKDWGYTYLKLDGLHIGLASPQTYPNLHYVEDHYGDAVFADKSKSNMQAGRAGLKAVREAAGPETFILGCCSPQNERSLGMTMGLVDAMRVGPDSGVNWGGVVTGVRCSSALYFLNGRVFWNDPDSIYARAAVPLNEVQCFAGWVTLTGMLNNQTDWAPDYPPDRVDLLRRTMPAHQLTSIRPVDLFENDPPRVWVLTYDVSGQKHTVIGLFNWTDKETQIGATVGQLGLKNAAGYAAFEFWSNRLLAPFRKELRERVPPRSCRIVAVRELGDYPVVLSTSRHVTQGAVDLAEETWDGGRNTLSGASRVVGGDPYELRVLAPAAADKPHRWQEARAEISQEDQAAGASTEVAEAGGLIRVKILSPASRTVRWSVRFSGAGK